MGAAIGAAIAVITGIGAGLSIGIATGKASEAIARRRASLRIWPASSSAAASFSS